MLLLLTACEQRDISTVSRPNDPVVLTGAQVPSLTGVAPNRIVAFNFVYGNWVQQPVQVDERAVLDLSKPRNGAPTGKTARFYTDANTWTGADPDPTFDADDELSFMVPGAFGQARSIDDDAANFHYTLTNPPHVVPGSGVQVQIADPLVAGSAAWIYLFRSDGTLDPAAGAAPAVNYTFSLASGDYKTTYHLGSGQNPENSVVTTNAYSAHFGDRWILDQIKIKAGGATNVDVLDLQKFAFVGSCGRSEYTFREGGGGLIANKSGPVRAIRSLMGANSGTYTQRDYIMYATRMNIDTYLRVHSVPAPREWMDYSAAAIGMQYLSSTTPAGVTIDGSHDTVSTAIPTWEMVRGAQGSIVHTNTLVTDVPGATSHLVQFYNDQSPATATDELCSGDTSTYGGSGAVINQVLPNTDPTLGAANTLRSTRSMTFLGPNAPTAQAEAIGAQAAAPVTVALTPFTP
jgi:hypothetical protein